MTDRNQHVLARDRRTNEVRQVYRRKDGGFTRNPDSKGSKGLNRPALFTLKEARKAVEWGKRQKPDLAVFHTNDKWPFVVKDDDTGWAKPDLMHKLNELGRRRKRYIWGAELRRPQLRQHELRMAYLSGRGNLAALCNSGGLTGFHSWAECRKYPPSQSNHATGDAADASILHSGRSGSFTNIGNDSRARQIAYDLGLGFPVPGEPWHLEIR